MGKRVFVSYCHKQGSWVHERLLPVIRAGGCEHVFVDTERGVAGQGVRGQMDDWQDQAEVSLLVLTPDYWASEYCRHEMQRAIAKAGGAGHGVLPVVRQACDTSGLANGRDPWLWVDLTDDGRAEPWTLLLSLDAEPWNCPVPHWLDVRDELVRKLRDQRQSVNLVVRGEPNWRALRDHLRELLPRLAVVDLDDPATATLDGLVGQILKASGNHASVPRGAASVAALNGLKASPDVTFLALCHFENVQARRKAYGVELFFALRHLVMDERKLILLVQSRVPFRELLPKDHPLSNLHLHVVELQGTGG